VPAGGLREIDVSIGWKKRLFCADLDHASKKRKNAVFSSYTDATLQQQQQNFQCFGGCWNVSKRTCYFFCVFSPETFKGQQK